MPDRGRPFSGDLPFPMTSRSSAGRSGRRSGGGGAVLSLLLILGAGGCSGSDGSPEAAAVPRWALSAEARATIGKLEGEAPYLFERIAAAALLPDGRVAVADAGAGVIRIFREDGSFENEFGRSGEGPGEFRRLNSLSIVPPDTIVTFDSDLYRLSMFLPSGDLISIFQVHAADGMAELYLGSYSMGGHAFGWIKQIPRDWSAVTPDMMEYGRFGPDGRVASVLAVTPGMRRLRSPLPFSPHPLHGMIGDSVLITDGLLPEISVVDPFGTLVRSIPIPVHPVDAAEVWGRFESELRQRADSGAFQRLADTPRLDSVPQIARLLVDDEDRLWVKRYDPLLDSHWFGRPGTGGEWQVLDPTGELIAEIRLPDRFLPLDVHGGRVLGMTKDDLGVERIQLFDLIRENPPEGTPRSQDFGREGTGKATLPAPVPEPNREEGPGWRVAAEPVLAIGSLDGAEEYQFVDLSAAISLEDGGFLVADVGTKTVRRFAGDGTFVRTLGGPGFGPGEFQNPTSLLGLDGDTVVVWDQALLRATTFDPEGRLVGEERLDMASIAKAVDPPLYPGSVELLEAGTFLVRLVEKAGKEVSPGSSRTRSGALRFSQGSSAVDTLMFFGDIEQVAVDAPWGPWRIAPPGARNTSIAHGGDPPRICIGDQEGPAVSCFDSAGGRTVLSWASERFPVSPDEIEDWQRENLRLFEMKMSEEEALRILRLVPTPEVRPAYSRIILDEPGNLWVELGPSERNGADRVDYLVFDTRGERVGVVGLPPVRVLQIGTDYVMGVHRDGLGVEYLHLHALTKNPGVPTRY